MPQSISERIKAAWLAALKEANLNAFAVEQFVMLVEQNALASEAKLRTAIEEMEDHNAKTEGIDSSSL